MPNREKINARGIEVTLLDVPQSEDCISLTDIARYRSDKPAAVVANWLRNHDVIEFLGLWEALPSAWCRARDVEENLVPSEVGEAQLIVLSNLESYNAKMVKRGLDQGCRLEALNRAAREQLSLLLRSGAAEGLESGRMSSEHGLPPVS